MLSRGVEILWNLVYCLALLGLSDPAHSAKAKKDAGSDRGEYDHQPKGAEELLELPFLT